MKTLSQTHKFRAIIEDAGNGGAYVSIPFDVEAAFGKKRVKVVATIEGMPYRGSLVRMGTTCHILGIRKDIRKQICSGIGDEIEVTVVEDTEERMVVVPANLAAALEESTEAKANFDKLSYSHQKEYVNWIEEAKHAETRMTRIEQTITQPANK